MSIENYVPTDISTRLRRARKTMTFTCAGTVLPGAGFFALGIGFSAQGGLLPGAPFFLLSMVFIAVSWAALVTLRAVNDGLAGRRSFLRDPDNLDMMVSTRDATDRWGQRIEEKIHLRY